MHRIEPDEEHKKLLLQFLTGPLANFNRFSPFFGWPNFVGTPRKLVVWYENIQTEDEQKKITDFIGVPWKPTDFWGLGGNWSGCSSHWERWFDERHRQVFDRRWREVKGMRLAGRRKDAQGHAVAGASP